MSEKREFILDVARKRFERFGVKKTTVDEISRDAGISKKTLYEHFKTKEELFQAVFIREGRDAFSFLAERIYRVDNALEKLEQMLRNAVAYHMPNSFMTQVLRDEDGLYAPYLKEAYRLQVEAEVLDFVAGILQEGIDQGVLRPHNTRSVAYYLFKLFQSFTFAKTDSLTGDASDLDELIDLVLQGVVQK